MSMDMSGLLREIDEIREKVDTLLVENAELYRLADDAVEEVGCAAENRAVPSMRCADALRGRLEEFAYE